MQIETRLAWSGWRRLKVNYQPVDHCQCNRRAHRSTSFAVSINVRWQMNSQPTSTLQLSPTIAKSKWIFSQVRIQWLPGHIHTAQDKNTWNIESQPLYCAGRSNANAINVILNLTESTEYELQKRWKKTRRGPGLNQTFPCPLRNVMRKATAFSARVVSSFPA